MSDQLPKGFRVGGVHCGIKSDAQVEDLTLIISDEPAVAAGVYTQNVVYAASVGRNRRITPSDNIRAVIANSGNANTCTGERGEEDNRQMAKLAAGLCDADEDQVLVMSTGIIGEYLPMQRITAGIESLAQSTGNDDESLSRAARGISTTDKFEKVATQAVSIADANIRITGIAKGAGMIGPRMATMLCAIMTDARLTPDDAQAVLETAVDESFNCISVEGHMSTSDTVLLLASGNAHDTALSKADLSKFQTALTEVCIELAKMIPRDGEGANHLIEIQVTGCASRDDAHQIAKTIANSALVKTGVAGNDPNWGRIISAAGYSGVTFDPGGMTLRLNEHLLYDGGEPRSFDKFVVSASLRDHGETFIKLQLSEGEAGCTFWTSDLTLEYVRFNSDYHT